MTAGILNMKSLRVIRNPVASVHQMWRSVAQGLTPPICLQCVHSVDLYLPECSASVYGSRDIYLSSPFPTLPPLQRVFVLDMDVAYCTF